jgi:predicted DNA-binding protein with PD1-like motif
MWHKEKNNIIIIRLFPDEDIHENIKKVCSKFDIRTGIILSGIGQIKEFELGFFNKEKNKYVTKKFFLTYELLSLSGNVCYDNENFIIHLHVVLGDEKMNTVGGHLINGIVEVTNEIILLKCDMNSFDLLKKDLLSYNGKK